MQKTVTLVMVAMMMTRLCFALEPLSQQEIQPECISVTTLSQLTGAARNNALADLAVLRKNAPMAIAYGIVDEDIEIFTYEAVIEENGLVHQTTFYNLSNSTRANGIYGGGYTTSYLLSGVSLFKIYLYASFDVTPGCVNGNRSQSQIWASETSVTLSGSSISFQNENTATCYANGSCRYNYQSGKYTGSFSGTVYCTDTGVVRGNDTTVKLG